MTIVGIGGDMSGREAAVAAVAGINLRIAAALAAVHVFAYALVPLVLMPIAPLGVWLGVRLTRHIRPTWFYRLAYTGMFLTGVKLLWDGVR